MPPTTIGRRPAASASSISAWASSAYWPALNVASTGRNDEQPVLERRSLAGIGGAGQDRQTGIDLERIGRHRHRILAPAAQRSASATATPVFPTPGGPEQRDHLGLGHPRSIVKRWFAHLPDGAPEGAFDAREEPAPGSPPTLTR